MKKSILLFGALLFGFNAFAQLQVSTTPQNKKVLLEEFTGIYCGYCPDGHVRANNLKATHGADFWVINIHVGGYANPQGGDPDFRTPFGTGIVGQTDLQGYPAGTINRHLFSGMSQGTGTAMSRGNWASTTTTTLAESAYANLAMEAQVDEQTRELRVITQYYYTAAGTGTSNKLNIALLQNNIEGPQSGAATFNPSNILPNGNYVHQHMLRHMVTGQWGQDISNVAMGATATDTFYYTIPAALNSVDYDLSNLEIVAFIAEGQQEVITATGGDVTVVNHANAVDAEVATIEPLLDVCAGSSTVSQSPTVKIRNSGANTLTSIDFSYDVNGGTASTYQWTGSLEYGETEYITLPVISFTPQASNTLNVNITDANGSVDPNAVNNTVNTTFGSSNITANSTNITIKITLDQWGSETSWTLTNSAGTVVATNPAGYSDAGASGAYPQADVNLTLPDDCYTFEIFDSYGDGMCCGYGNGGYEIHANGVLVAGLSGGSFSNGDGKAFAVEDAPTSVETIVGNNFKLFPNPAASELNIAFEEMVNEAIVSVVDVQGRVIISQNINNTNFEQINVADLTNGIYMVVINADGKTTTEKISVLK